MEILAVEVGEFGEAASELLRAAWALPSVYYSPEYLRWQFGFPGPLPTQAVAAMEGGRAVAFVGAVNRRVRLGETERDVYLSSFHCARPGCGGAAAVGVLGRLVREARSVGAAIVSFAAPDQAGERMLLAGFRDFGHRSLGTCVTYGGFGRMGGVDGWVAEEPAGDEELSAAIREGGGEAASTAAGTTGVLWSAPTGEQRAHYREDPRGRRWVVVRPAVGGSAVGAALLVRAEVMTAERVRAYVTVDSAWLGAGLEESAAGQALAAVVRCAARVWAGDASAPVVVAPNLSCLSKQSVRTGGMRELPGATAFAAHLFSARRDDPLLAARGINLEVV